MQIPPMGQAWELRLPPVSKLVLLKLSFEADTNRLCQLSYQQLADFAGTSIQPIRHAVRLLEAKGLIRKRRPFSHAYIYEVLL